MGWIEVIHDCPTPSQEAIKEQEAQVGSIWECNSSIPGLEKECGDRWRLRQIRNEDGVRGAVGKFPKWQRLSVNGEAVPGTASSAEQSDPEDPRLGVLETGAEPVPTRTRRTSSSSPF